MKSFIITTILLVSSVSAFANNATCTDSESARNSAIRFLEKSFPSLKGWDAAKEILISSKAFETTMNNNSANDAQVPAFLFNTVRTSTLPDGSIVYESGKIKVENGDCDHINYGGDNSLAQVDIK